MTTAVNGNWAHAVPLDETNGFSQPQRADTLRSQDSRMSGQREFRTATGRRPSDYTYQSDSEAAGSRRASIRATNASTTKRKRSRNTLRDTPDPKPAAAGPVDDSAWIHRDKLAQIEIKEMEEAGIHVRQSRRSLSAGPGARDRSSRSPSRSGARRPVSRDRQNEHVAEEQLVPQHTSFDDYQRKRVSTIPAEDEDEHEGGFDSHVDSELRTPEEVAAEQQLYKQHMIRPSTSRIPISKASVVPVPQTVVDRDSPLPRSRNGSGAWTGAWDEMQYARKARSNSFGSQVLLDDPDGFFHTPPRPGSSHLRTSDENSPPKARMPNKGAAASGARKTSTPQNGVPRPTSSHVNKPASSKRPTSSSGHKSRPSTSHAPPEGEAPWIASMYKPDPRLPQDEQLLPTHAKRMMQEQWEKDGKTGTAYDRDLNLLNDQEFQQPKLQTPTLKLDDRSRWTLEQPNGNLNPHSSPQQTDNTSPSRRGSNQPWPLSPARSDTKSDNGSVRPGTSGGYKITPTIASPPPIQRSPNSNSAPSVDNAAPHNPTPRVPDFDEKDMPEPKKGCCCIVM